MAVIKVGDIINWKSCIGDGFEWKVTKMVGTTFVTEIQLFKNGNVYKLGPVYNNSYGWNVENLIKIRSYSKRKSPSWL